MVRARRLALLGAVLILGSVVADRSERTPAQDAGYHPLPVGEPVLPKPAPAPARATPPASQWKWGPPAKSANAKPPAPPREAPPTAKSQPPAATSAKPVEPASHPEPAFGPRLGALPPPVWSPPVPATATAQPLPASPPSAPEPERPALPAPGAAPAPMPAGPVEQAPAAVNDNVAPPAKDEVAPAPAPSKDAGAPTLGAPAVRAPLPARPASSAGAPAPTPPAAPSPTVPTVGALVETIGPTELPFGKSLAYEVVARNPGPVALYYVRVIHEPPPECQLLSAEPGPQFQVGRLVWEIGTLEPGGERRFKVQVQPRGDGELRSCSTVTYAATSCLRTIMVQPRLAVTKTGPVSVGLGEKAVFQLDVSNTGTAAATGVVLQDVLPSGLRHEGGSSIEADLGTLAPREVKHVTLAVTAVQAGRHVNQARVTAENAAPATAEAAVFVTAPVLALRKTGPQTRFINREAEFDLELANTGDAPARNVRVTDNLPFGLDFVSASDGGSFDPKARTVTWTVGTLAAGARRGLTVKVVATTPGDLVNRAVAVAEPQLEAKAEAPLNVQTVPALMLEVVDLDDPVEVGAETSYEIRVLNQGTSASQGLQIIADIPRGMAPKGASGPAAYRIQGQQVIFEPMPRLAPHADAVYRIQVHCREAGDWRVKVQMSCDQLRLPVHEEESTRIYKDN